MAAVKMNLGDVLPNLYLYTVYKLPRFSKSGHCLKRFPAGPPYTMASI